VTPFYRNQIAADRSRIAEMDALRNGTDFDLWTGDLDSATAHLERAYATALEGENDWTALAATAHLAIARAFRGEIQRALRHADDAVTLAVRRGWGRSEPAGAAYCVQAAVAIQRGQHEQAEALVARASEALHETRERPLRAVHALNRALLLSDSGEPEAALQRPAGRARRGRRVAAARPARGPAPPGRRCCAPPSASARWGARC
jgi:ATP/maltotriose-dependent transcriptional regulator MalT